MGRPPLFRSYVESCDFNVGALFAHDRYIFALAEKCAQIGVRLPVDYVFGSISCIMQGGRATPYGCGPDEAFAILDKYAELGIGCRLTFSSTDIEEEDLPDPLSNALLARLNEGEGNGVILSSDLLLEHVRSSYPNLECVASLVKPTVENTLGTEPAAYYNGLLERYDVAVVNSAFAYDDSFLEQIGRKEGVEFIANHRCRPNCPMSREHYITQTRAARAAAEGDTFEQQRLEDSLRQINNWCRDLRLERPCDSNLISTQRVEELADKGFVHYKIEGRDYPLNVLVRDIGTWIFHPEGAYLSMATGILGNPV